MENAPPCPRCAAPSLGTTFIGELTLDQCDECEGVWFDPGELRHLLDEGGGAVQGTELEKSLETEVVREEEPGGEHLACPRCRNGLRRYHYGYSSEVLVDGCDAGCGVWLDDGELRKLFRYAAKAAEELDPAVAKMVNERLDALAVKREERRERFIDSLVALDDKPGPLRPFGELMQAIATTIYKAQRRFLP